MIISAQSPQQTVLVPSRPSSSGEVLISARGVGKKFCRSLKRSMIYGVADLGRSMFGLRPDTTTLRRDEFWAVEDINFELRRGEILGLIGANGSGKSTLLRLLAGIFPPDQGEISIKGRVGALIALGAGFHPHMTGLENVYLNGTILGMNRREITERLDAIIDFAEIGEFVHAPVSTYSSGMRLRLGFAVAAHLEPDILLIDEVLAVGDIGFRTKCLNAIERMTRNAAVIFVSHQMPQVTRICSDVIVMNRGRSVYQGRDCLKGVEKYFAILGNTQMRIAGTGRASLNGLRLVSQEAQADGGSGEIVTIQSGGALTVELDLTIDPAVPRPIAHIAFFTIDERPVAQCDSDVGGFSFAVDGSSRHCLALRLDRLPLNPGRYHLSLLILDENRQEILYHHHGAAELQVVGSFMSYTPVHLTGSWSELAGDWSDGPQPLPVNKSRDEGV